jgi:hypothetical protein
LFKQAGYAAFCSEREIASAPSPDRSYVARALLWDCGGATTSFILSVMVERNHPWPVRALHTLAGAPDSVEVVRSSAPGANSTWMDWQDQDMLVIWSPPAGQMYRQEPWHGIRFTHKASR